MSDFARCADEIKAAVGRSLSKEEAATLKEVLAQFDKRQKQARTMAAGADAEAAVLKAADDFAQEMVAAATIEKRNAALSLRKRLETLDYVKTQFADNPALGLEAVMVGVNRAEPGARFSAARQKRALADAYMAGFMSDLERGGLREVLASGALDRDITRALWAIDNPDAPPFKGSKEAADIAAIMRKWQEAGRVDANIAGAWIKKMPGYVVRQSHDVYKIRAAGFDAWRDAVLPKLDMPRIMADMPDADVNAFLKATYDGLASGVHLKATTSTGFKGPRSLAKGLSQERVLHFKGADEWFDYNEQFGTGNLREAFLFGLTRTGESTGLMRALGPNPGATVAAVRDELMRLAPDDKARTRLRAAETKLANQMAELDGSVRIPGNAMAARVSSNLRAVTSMARLGGAVISSISDIPTYGSEMRYQGRTMLSGMADAIGGLVQGRPKGERAEVLAQLGVFFDSAVGDLAARFSANDDLGGKMSRAQRMFFRLNGLTWWTETLRSSAALSMSHGLALNAGRAFGALDGDLRRVLGLFGIDEGKWDIIRTAGAKEADGLSYLTPEGIRSLPDERFTAYLEGKGIKPTDAKIRDLKTEIEDQFRSYFVDRAEIAVLEPDARTRAFMLNGTRPGTFQGEMLRFIGQFKSFAAGFTQNVIGREVYGRGSKTLLEALKNGNGEMQGLAQLVLWTTLFGYGAMVAKDLAKGRTPRDPTDPKTWGAAMVQGGGLGIFGDFLFGEANRFSGGALETAAGPVIGNASDLIGLWNKARSGDDPSSEAFRFVLGNTPFVNLFYTRAALDYLLLYRIQEWLNPGSLRRMEKRVEKENGQTFLLPPSQNATFLGVR